MDQKRSIVAIPIVLLVAIGIAIAGSDGGREAFGLPVFALCFALAFVIQWAAFIPAYLKQTEVFFDLIGSLTFISILGLSLLLSSPIGSRALLLFGMITAWAVRLGSFLFRRIRSAGDDRRFRELKTSFASFLLTWTVQGLWVSLSLAAALAVITSEIEVQLGNYAIIGFVLWLIGFGIEVIADQQKSSFKSVPENANKFINVGLWSWSRHPNYFGEIILWIGVTIVALPVLSGWQWVTLISPIFVIVMLTRISGIPMLETRADDKWGGQEDYEEYKANTPILFPLPPSNKQ